MLSLYLLLLYVYQSFIQDEKKISYPKLSCSHQSSRWKSFSRSPQTCQPSFQLAYLQYSQQCGLLVQAQLYSLCWERSTVLKGSIWLAHSKTTQSQSRTSLHVVPQFSMDGIMLEWVKGFWVPHLLLCQITFSLLCQRLCVSQCPFKCLKECLLLCK